MTRRTNNNNSGDITPVLMVLAALVILAVSIYSVGRANGYGAGMDAAREIRDRVDCESDYGYKPVSEVPARCAKYFDLEIGGEE